MSPKRIIMISTMAFAIALSTALWSEDTSASTYIPSDKSDSYNKHNDNKEQAFHSTIQDPLQQALGLSSGDDIYEALSSGQSLADIANANDADIQNVIDLQTAEMTEQLDQRLASGSISNDVYEAQKAELTSIITNSVYGLNN
jgi:hypothetical protein